MILGIDPGTHYSGWVIFDPRDDIVYACGHHANALILAMLASPFQFLLRSKRPGVPPLVDVSQARTAVNTCVFETIGCYGQSAGYTTFRTAYWTGRFAQVWGNDVKFLDPVTIRNYLTGKRSGGKPAVRMALLERFGPLLQEAKGTKKDPGPCYGVAGHMWSALAVAVTWNDGIRTKSEKPWTFD